MLLHVSAANYSHPQVATSVGDMYSVLYRSSNISSKIFIQIIVNIKYKVVLKLDKN
jgi:hypothetical protein